MAPELVPSAPARFWRGWIVATLTAMTATVLSGYFWDEPLAWSFISGSRHIHLLGKIFSSPHMIGALTLLVGVLAAVRISSGRLSPFGKSLLVAASASLFAFTANDFVLKPLFGRPQVSDLLSGSDAAFHWLDGTYQSSFPSGHAAMASAMLAALACLHPRLLLPAILAQVIACILMVVGGWHFLSDTIAGTWLGMTAGLFAAQLWRLHLAAHGEYQDPAQKG